MNDVAYILFAFVVLFGACFAAELIAEYAPWIGYAGAGALIVYGMSKLYNRAFRN